MEKLKSEALFEVMMAEAGISGNLSNYNLRATTTTRLFNHCEDETIIKQQTRQRSNKIYSLRRLDDDKLRDVTRTKQTEVG